MKRMIRVKEYRLKKLQALPGFTFHKQDISQVIDHFKDHQFEGVINLAARPGCAPVAGDPWAYVETNMIGTLNMLEHAAAHRDKEVHRCLHLQHLWRGSAVPDPGRLPAVSRSALCRQQKRR